MTPEDWKYVENELIPPWGRIVLICDGYKVSLCVQRTSKMKYTIVVYVNGEIDFSWMRKDCDERNRFMRPVTRPLLTKAQQKAEKRLAKLCKRPSRHDVKYTYWVPDWTSVKSLRRHFCKHNQDIQLVRDEAATEAI